MALGDWPWCMMPKACSLFKIEIGTHMTSNCKVMCNLFMGPVALSEDERTKVVHPDFKGGGKPLHRDHLMNFGWHANRLADTLGREEGE